MIYYIQTNLDRTISNVSKKFKQGYISVDVPNVWINRFVNNFSDFWVDSNNVLHKPNGLKPKVEISTGELKEELEETNDEINSIKSSTADNSSAFSNALNSKADKEAINSARDALIAVNSSLLALPDKATKAELTTLKNEAKDSYTPLANSLAQLESSTKNKIEINSLSSYVTKSDYSTANSSFSNYVSNNLSSLENKKIDSTKVGSIENSLTNKINSKADQLSLNELSSNMDSKADKLSLNKLSSNMDSKATVSYVDNKSYILSSTVSSLGNRVDNNNELSDAVNDLNNQTTLKLNNKADINSLNNISNHVDKMENTKADRTDLTSKADSATVSSANSILISNIKELNSNKANSDTVETIRGNLQDQINTFNDEGSGVVKNVGAIQEQVNGKANKADLEAVSSSISNKVDKSDLDLKLNQKVDKNGIDSLTASFSNKISSKANLEDFNSLSTVFGSHDNKINSLNSFANKLDYTAQQDRSNNNSLTSSLLNTVNNKVDNIHLSSVSDDLYNSIKNKANKSDVDAISNKKADNTQVSSVATSLTDSINTKASKDETKSMINSIQSSSFALNGDWGRSFADLKDAKDGYWHIGSNWNDAPSGWTGWGIVLVIHNYGDCFIIAWDNSNNEWHNHFGNGHWDGWEHNVRKDSLDNLDAKINSNAYRIAIQEDKEKGDLNGLSSSLDNKLTSASKQTSLDINSATNSLLSNVSKKVDSDSFNSIANSLSDNDKSLLSKSNFDSQVDDIKSIISNNSSFINSNSTRINKQEEKESSDFNSLNSKIDSTKPREDYIYRGNISESEDYNSLVTPGVYWTVYRTPKNSPKDFAYTALHCKVIIETDSNTGGSTTIQTIIVADGWGFDRVAPVYKRVSQFNNTQWGDWISYSTNKDVKDIQNQVNSLNTTKADKTTVDNNTNSINSISDYAKGVSDLSKSNFSKIDKLLNDKIESTSLYRGIYSGNIFDLQNYPSGKYWLTGVNTNSPVGNNIWGEAFVEQLNQYDTMLICYIQDNVYYNATMSGNWKGWIKIVNENDINDLKKQLDNKASNDDLKSLADKFDSLKNSLPKQSDNYKVASVDKYADILNLEGPGAYASEWGNQDTLKNFPGGNGAAIIYVDAIGTTNARGKRVTVINSWGGEFVNTWHVNAWTGWKENVYKNSINDLTGLINSNAYRIAVQEGKEKNDIGSLQADINSLSSKPSTANPSTGSVDLSSYTTKEEADKIAQQKIEQVYNNLNGKLDNLLDIAKPAINLYNSSVATSNSIAKSIADSLASANSLALSSSYPYSGKSFFMIGSEKVTKNQGYKSDMTVFGKVKVPDLDVNKDQTVTISFQAAAHTYPGLGMYENGGSTEKTITFLTSVLRNGSTVPWSSNSSGSELSIVDDNVLLFRSFDKSYSTRVSGNGSSGTTNYAVIKSITIQNN